MNDDEMTLYARTNGEVIVRIGDRHRLATLLAWKPARNDGSKRRRNSARVRFTTGIEATIRPLSRISLPNNAGRGVAG